MSNLSDIKKSITEMTDEELFALVREHRASRRAGTSSMPGKRKPTKKAVAIGKAINVEKMDRAQAEALLKMLQGES